MLPCFTGLHPESGLTTFREVTAAPFHLPAPGTSILCQENRGDQVAPGKVLPRHSNKHRNTISVISLAEKTAAKNRLEVAARAREPCRLKSATKRKKRKVT